MKWSSEPFLVVAPLGHLLESDERHVRGRRNTTALRPKQESSELYLLQQITTPDGWIGGISRLYLALKKRNGKHLLDKLMCSLLF